MSTVKFIRYCDPCATLEGLSNQATKEQATCTFCKEDAYCNIGPAPKPVVKKKAPAKKAASKKAPAKKKSTKKTSTKK